MRVALRLAEPGRRAMSGKLNIVLTALLVLCALSLVNAQYQARHLFIELERTQPGAPARYRMGAAAARPVHAGQARAHRRIARRDLNMTPLTPARTQYLTGGPEIMRAAVPPQLARAASKGVSFSKSPVLAVRCRLAFARGAVRDVRGLCLALAGRALWLQGLSTQFLQKQGEIRYARTWNCRPRAARSPTAMARCWRRRYPSRPSGRSRTMCWKRRRQNRALAEAAGNERGRAAQEARFGPQLRLPEAPGRAGCGGPDRGAGSTASTPARNTSASIRRAK
jgi:cell division protein FtsL